MAITASSIINKVRTILQETTPGGIRWLDAELLGWLNDGQREIVSKKPSAGAVNGNMQLTAGTLQKIPDGGDLLLNVYRNMGIDGATPGKIIRVIDREVLDTENPDWHTDAAASSVKVYVFDENDPTSFYVYPPADGTGHINLLYSAAPTEVATLNDNITIPDIYSNPLIDYVLFRAYNKNINLKGKDEFAGRHWNLFLESLGAKTHTEGLTSPNNELVDGKHRIQ